MKLLIFLLCICFLLVNPSVAEHPIQQKLTESLNYSQNISKNTLIELFTSTNGENWITNDGWLSPSISYCQWRGVLCDSNLNVISLRLAENGLFGSLPDSIGNLKALKALDLGSNFLNGTIPDTIGELSEVQYFSLYTNELSGSIPSSIERMASLQYMELFENELSGTLPESIVRLLNLRSINLYRNQLSGTIPDTIGLLANLQTLMLDSNQLSGTIPSTIGQLISLQELGLNSNRLTGTIPDGIGRIFALRTLELDANQFTGGIPASIASLAVLQTLNLSANQLTGTIPERIGTISRLQFLALDSNQLNGTIPALGQLSRLQYLSVGSNRILGTIPSSLWAIKGLLELNLAGNSLDGTISDALGDMRALKRLTLSENNFSGPLPNLEGLSQLENVNLANNNFRGCLSLPSQFKWPNTTCQVAGNNFCCAKDNYHCFEASCVVEGTLIVSSGATVQYAHNSATQNIVVQEGGVLALESTNTINVDCFQLEGELHVDTNVSLDGLILVRSTCQTVSPAPNITTSSPFCEPKIFLAGSELRGSIVCTLPADNSRRDTIIIVVSVVGGSAVLSGAIVLIVLIRRRRRRINQLKSRVELLTVSTASTNKGSSPPNEFTFKLLEDLPIKLSKTDFKFALQGNLCIVGENYTDNFTIQAKNTAKHTTKSTKGSLRDSLLNKKTLVQFRPIKSPKHQLVIEPQGFELPHESSVEVTLRLTLTMTTKTKVSFWIELPEEQIYSLIEFDAASEPSPWIDVDEVEIDGEAIGEGGFGAVYKAYYRGQKVAFKTLKLQELGASFDKEFEQEVRMMRHLHHKNILQFIGASRVRRKLAILTEFISQGNLAQLLAEKTLDIELKKKIILDIAEALYFLHSNNILHRDIKAENILVVSTLKEAIVNVKLADFGTARSTTEQVTSKFTKGVGTPIYMAVEVLKNETYERSADVFSFGVLVWAIMTQEEPYKELVHSWDVAEFVLQGKRLPIRDEWPAAYKDIITRCWAQNPRDRPTTKEIVALLSNGEEVVELEN